MQYEDCGHEALIGVYNKDFHNVANHVHPVVAALFLPKIDILEQHFIHSNIAGIVKSRYNKEQFTSMADALLYDALIKDPNDVVCDSRSTMIDIHNRANLQTQLWNMVLNLRNGQYYNNSFQEFINAVDICRMNKYDNPDLVYGRHDGTILKRILAAFSFRPTVVTSIPAYQVTSINPYQQNIRPMVTYIPIINMKIPFGNDDEPIDLTDSLEQTQLVLENGVVMPKQTSLVYSRGVLFFYIDRRSNVIYKTQELPSFIFGKLPSAVAGFSRLNKRLVNFDTTLNIRNDRYNLRSVVLSEINDLANENNLVIGSSSIFMVHKDYEAQRYSDECFIYNPYSVVKSRIIGDSYQRINQPIQQLPDVALDQNSEGFIDMARSRGIIFVYELVKDSTSGTLAY